MHQAGDPKSGVQQHGCGAGSGTTAGSGSVLLGNYRFPWDRAFEIGMDIELGAFTAQHKGTYEMYTP